MEYEKIKQLMEDMGNSKLTSISIDFPDGTKISMEKQEKQVRVENVLPKEVVNVENVERQELKQENNRKVENEGYVVKSPMVGTFYAKPSPNSEAYVGVGQKVKKGDILCIIEAMKLMNEIESEFDGEVVEVLVKDGEAVEYGKPLFVIK